mmetsp:Transcript_42769/g.115353  ORF Transcript_42769/g.115353 Transcript_42769/m.115353 type:complete len:207 (+) Transcript_42769:491-1111(+)
MLSESHGVLEVGLLVSAAQGVGSVDEDLPAAGPVLHKRPAEASLFAHVLNTVPHCLPKVRVKQDVAIPSLLLEVAAVAEGVVPLRLPTHLLKDRSLAVPLPELRNHNDVRVDVCDRGGDAVHALRPVQILVVDVERRQLHLHIHPSGGRAQWLRLHFRMGGPLAEGGVLALVPAAAGALDGGAVLLLQQQEPWLSTSPLATRTRGC